MKAKRTPQQAQPESTAWVRMSAGEWTGALERARTTATRRLARYGLDLDGHDERKIDDPQHITDVASTIIETAIGRDLAPSLALDRATLRAVVKTLGNPVVSAAGDREEELDSFLWGYHIKIADAAFLFGLITGTMVTWPMIQAIDPPNRPPTPKGGGARKG